MSHAGRYILNIDRDVRKFAKKSSKGESVLGMVQYIMDTTYITYIL